MRVASCKSASDQFRLAQRQAQAAMKGGHAHPQEGSVAPAVVLVEVVQLIVEEDRRGHAARRCQGDITQRACPIQLHAQDSATDVSTLIAG